VKTFAVAAPQFSGQRTVKEKKRKVLATQKTIGRNFTTFAATHFLSRKFFFHWISLFGGIFCRVLLRRISVCVEAQGHEST
jgi:hypothetical protein